jgi:hypothetical protein
MNKLKLGLFSLVACAMLGPRAQAQIPPPPCSPVQLGSGPVLKYPEVNVIFWGSAWQNGTPGTYSAQKLLAIVQKLVNGPYLDNLAQYGITRARTTAGADYVSSNPSLNYTAADVATLVQSEMQANRTYNVDRDGNLGPNSRRGGALHIVFLPFSGDRSGHGGGLTVQNHEYTYIFVEDGPNAAHNLSGQLVNAITDPHANFSGISISGVMALAEESSSSFYSTPKTRCADRVIMIYGWRWEHQSPRISASASSRRTGQVEGRIARSLSSLA